MSRPDIAYAVGILSQYIQNPGPAHWEALKRVIIYLGTTKNYWLILGGNQGKRVEGYSNADWAGQTDRHLILGYAFLLGCGAMS